MNNREKFVKSLKVEAMYGDNHKEEIEEINRYIQNLKQLSETNPELAKKVARENLQKCGIIDKDGKLAPPYNGQKVHDTDFTRWPRKIYYEEYER